MAGTSNFTKREFFYGSVEDDRDQNYSVHTKGRKKLLVFGLGGLLCHRICRKDTAEVPIVHRRPDAVYGSYAVYKRPYCEEFMKFCLSRFEVGIWSSAREWYLNSALDCIMSGLRSKILFAWDQNECTNTGVSCLEKKEKPIFLKELKKVWDRNWSSSLQHRDEYSASNTLLIDDKPYKALLNPPYTAIFPSEYKANQVNDNSLGPDGELWRYLEGLAAADDVPSYVKAHPFGQPAITPMHSDWDYYSKIMVNIQGTRKTIAPAPLPFSVDSLTKGNGRVMTQCLGSTRPIKYQLKMDLPILAYLKMLLILVSSQSGFGDFVCLKEFV
ncbi:hypothetical protein POUND7_001691 [Theobroma cacao]